MTINASTNKPERCWNRSHQVTPSPLRFLHRGNCMPNESESFWLTGKNALAYAADSGVTAVVRLAATPAFTARASAQKGRRKGGRLGAAVGGTVGFLYGVPKGILGAGVSLAVGASSLYVGSVGQLVGVCFGTGECVYRGASAADNVFARPEEGTGRRVAPETAKGGPKVTGAASNASGKASLHGQKKKEVGMADRAVGTRDW